MICTAVQEWESVHYIWILCSPVIIVIGTVGNSLSIATLSRKDMRNLTSAFYFIVLAIADLLALYVGFIPQFLKTFTGCHPIRDLSQVTCKVHIFLVYFLGQFSSWILVSVAAERFISVWFPLKSKHYCSRKIALIALCVIAACLMIADSHFFWTRELSPDGNGTTRVSCSYLEEFEQTMQSVWTILDSVLFMYAPCLIMILLNALIIIKIKQRQRHNRVSAGSNCNSSDRVTTMTAMLLTATFTFILLMAPITLYLTGQYLWWKPAKDAGDERLSIYRAVAYQLMYLNNAINFLLYYASGSKFREVFKRTFNIRRHSNSA